MREVEPARIIHRKAEQPARSDQEGEAVMFYTTTMVRLAPAVVRGRLGRHPDDQPVQSGASRAAAVNAPDRLRAAALGCGSSLVEPLTAREVEVLELLLHGADNREIADGLTISPRTVETHLTNIYGKLGVRGRSEAILRTMREALLERQPAGYGGGAFLPSLTLIVQRPSRASEEEGGSSGPGAWSSW